MTYILKNTSKTMGMVRVGDKWKNVPAGESISIKDVPSLRTHNVTIIPIPDTPPVKSKPIKNESTSSPAIGDNNG